MKILSIQSAVAYGHVGNSAAVFPLQRLGAEVWPIDTVQFSNHPGHGSHTGSVTQAETIRALVDGIEALGVLPGCDALLTGYVGDPGTGAALLHAEARLRAAKPDALWCCDPVIGDAGPGIYVRPGVYAFFRDRAIPAADILTPNHFELGLIAGRPCTTLAESRQAASALIGRMRVAGPRVVLVTSLRCEDTPGNAIDLLAVMPGASHRLRTPLLGIAANGAGDAIAALFLFHFLRTRQAHLAMEEAASSVHGLLSHTLSLGRTELALVEAQSQFVHPDNRFRSEPC